MIITISGLLFMSGMSVQLVAKMDDHNNLMFQQLNNLLWRCPPYFRPPLVFVAWPNSDTETTSDAKRMHTIQSVRGLNIIIIMIQIMTVTGYASSAWHVAFLVRSNTFGWRLRVPAVVGGRFAHSCKTSFLNPPIKHTHTYIVDHKASGKYLFQ